MQPRRAARQLALPAAALILAVVGVAGGARNQSSYWHEGVAPRGQRSLLLWAAERGDPEVIAMVSGQKPGAWRRPDVRDPEGNSPLHLAVHRGDRAAAEALLLSGADLEATNAEGRTPLHLAAAAARDQVLDLLARSGAALDARDRAGNAPVHLAANSSEATVRLLVEYGADVNVQNTAGESPLHISVGRSNEAVLLLTKYGADVNVQNNDGVGPLHLAVAANEEAVRLLTKYGADVNLQNNDGDAPLHIAADGHDESVKMLTKYGANPNTQNNNGTTPVHLAARRNYETLKHLLAVRARPNISDHEGQTPLHWAAAAGRDDCVRELIAAGANPATADRAGRTAADVAFLASRFDTWDLLVGSHPRLNCLHSKAVGSPYHCLDASGVNTPGPFGMTPLHFTVTREPGYAAELISMGAEVGARDWYGRTALHLAAAGDDSAAGELIATLVAAGADANAADSAGRTPLHEAARRARPSAARALLDAGARANASDVYGRTPLHAAVRALPRRVTAEDEYSKLLVSGRTHVPTHLKARKDVISEESTEETVAELLRGGADPEALDSLGRSPMDLASSARVRELLQMDLASVPTSRYLDLELNN